MNLLALAWLTEIGLMQYRAATQGRPLQAGGGKLLWPSDLVASFVVYGGLSVVAEISPDWARAAGGAGWVLVLATWLNLVDPTLEGAQRQAQLAGQATGGLGAGGTQPTGGPAPAGAAASNPGATGAGFGFAGLPIVRTGGGARAR